MDSLLYRNVIYQVKKVKVKVTSIMTFLVTVMVRYLFLVEAIIPCLSRHSRDKHELY